MGRRYKWTQYTFNGTPLTPTPPFSRQHQSWLHSWHILLWVYQVLCGLRPLSHKIMGWIKCRNFFTYYSPLTHWHIKTQLDWFWLILYTIWNKNINHYLNICTFFANSFTNFGNVHFFRWFRNSAGYVKSAMLKNRNCPQRLMSQVGLFQEDDLQQKEQDTDVETQANCNAA